MRFPSDFEKVVIAEVESTSWRLRECIRVRELAATKTRANASFADVRGAEGLEARGRLRSHQDHSRNA